MPMDDSADGGDGQGDEQVEARDDLEAPEADEAGQDIDVEEEAERQRGLRDPGTPTKAEREEHDLTHIPYRPWCDACVRGRAKDKRSLRLTQAYAHSCVPRVRLDYCYLTEKAAGDTTESGNGENESEAWNGIEGDHNGDEGENREDDAQEAERNVDDSATVLVMQESLCRSVWAYDVEKKGATEDWVVSQMMRSWTRSACGTTALLSSPTRKHQSWICRKKLLGPERRNSGPQSSSQLWATRTATAP